MAASSEDVAQLMSNISLQDTNPPLPPQKPPTSVQQASKALAQAASATVAEASRVQRMPAASAHEVDVKVAALCSLRRSTRDLQAAIENANNTFESSIARYICSSSSLDHDVPKLLAHFKGEITVIVGSVLDNVSHDETALWRILEQCYRESSISGKLHPEEYLDQHSEASGKRGNREHETTARWKTTVCASWSQFWVDALATCDSGPTLFGPTRVSDFRSFADLPRYLFRTFDSRSSGLSNETIMASSASNNMPDLAKVDLLSLDRKEATSRLVAHLNKKPWIEYEYDNLMSWSSSLLFVLQYAVYRCYKGKASAADVRICAIDTTKYPRGQFVKDMSLVSSVYSPFDRNEEMEKLLRLRRGGYDNGEYLSQGTVHHQGRSSVASLELLINAGLYDLYPDFKDEEGRYFWTNRVKDLRAQWSSSHDTSFEDIQIALQIAASCFPSLRSSDVALALLAFRNRNSRDGEKSAAHSFRHSYRTYGPEEVQRSYKYAATFRSQEDSKHAGLRLDPEVTAAELQDFFKVSSY